MRMNDKTFVGMMNLAALQAKKFAEILPDVDLASALATSSQIVAKSVEKETSASATGTLKDTFVSTFYNKFSNGDKLYTEDVAPEETPEDKKFADDKIYIEVAQSQPDTVDTVVIGGFTFGLSNRFKKISVGKNAFLYLNVWKIDKGVLKVAVPYLYAGTDYTTGVCKVIAGGLCYNVNVVDPIPVEKTLKIKSIEMSAKEGFTGVVEKVDGRANHVDVTFSHAAQALLCVMTDGESDITSTSETIFSITTDGNMGITTPERFGSVDCTYAAYLIPWKNEPVKVPVNGEKRYYLALPKYGTMELAVDYHAIVEPEKPVEEP